MMSMVTTKYANSCVRIGIVFCVRLMLESRLRNWSAVFKDKKFYTGVLLKNLADFDWPNAEIAQKMANGRLLSLFYEGHYRNYECPCKSLSGPGHSVYRYWLPGSAVCVDCHKPIYQVFKCID